MAIVKNSTIKNKKILITGGMGFIGSSLIQSLALNNKITVFDNGRRNAFQFLDQSLQKQVKIVNGDILDYPSVSKIAANQDIVIHLAAIAGASFYEKEPLLTFDVNFHGAENILKSFVGKKVEKIILFSSSEVYGSLAQNVSETDVTAVGPANYLRWSYAASKLSSEHLAFGYLKKHNLPVIIIRPFNIYGPLQVGEGAITGMVKGALLEQTIKVTGDGKQKRSWCYIDDLIDAIIKICASPVKGEIYNIGNPYTSVSILELAQRIQMMGDRVNIKFIEEVKSEILDRYPNIDKAKKELGFNPQYQLDMGLSLTFTWIKENIKLLS